MTAIFSILIFLALAALAVAGGNADDARWEVDRDRLAEGTNLIYAVFGDALAAPPGIQGVLSNLQLPASAVVVSIDVGVQRSMDSVKAIKKLQEHAQQAQHSQVVLVLHNVEVLRSRAQLLNLDFLFRLPDKAFGMSSLVVLILWNTSNMQALGQMQAPQRVEIDVSAEDFQLEPEPAVGTETDSGHFWTVPRGASRAMAEREWREGVRSLWAAAGPEFNADAAIGRITRAIFLPASAPGASAAATVAALPEGLLSVGPALNDWLRLPKEAPAAGASDKPPFGSFVLARVRLWLRAVKARMLKVKILHAVKVVLLALLLLFFALLLRQAFEAMHGPQQQEYQKHVRSMQAQGAAWRRQQEQEQEQETVCATTGTAAAE